VCTKSGTCGGGCEVAVIDATATLGVATTTVRTEAAVAEICALSTLSSQEKICQGIRTCAFNDAGICGFLPTYEADYQNCIIGQPPVQPPVCKGFSNPCLCDFQYCLYVEGKVSIPDATTGVVIREIPIGQCLPYDVAQKTAEVLAPQTTVAGAFATAPTTTTSTTVATDITKVTVTTVSTLPSVCFGAIDVVSVEQKTVVAVSDPIITKIFKDGLDTTTVVTKWADQIKTDATLSGVIPRIISFGIPKVSAKGDVSISTIVEVVSTVKLTPVQLTNLCAKYKQSIASTVGASDADFSACQSTEIKTLSSHHGKKRAALQTASDQYVMDVSYTRASGSSAMTISSLLILMLVVLLFGLNA
jgi:hypothetical protein